MRSAIIRFIKEILRAKTIHEVIAKELREAHLKKLEAAHGIKE